MNNNFNEVSREEFESKMRQRHMPDDLIQEILNKDPSLWGKDNIQSFAHLNNRNEDIHKG